MSERDQYDDAIDYLTAHPHEIDEAWGSAGSPMPHEASCLFDYAGRPGDVRDGFQIGCLTQVRHGDSVAATQALTDEIAADERIPADSEDITVYHLPVFAEWQRRLDREGIR